MDRQEQYLNWLKAMEDLEVMPEPSIGNMLPIIGYQLLERITQFMETVAKSAHLINETCEIAAETKAGIIDHRLEKLTEEVANITIALTGLLSIAEVKFPSRFDDPSKTSTRTSGQVGAQ